MSKRMIILLAVVILALSGYTACSKDETEEAANDLLPFDLVLDESDIGVDTPQDWVFLFGMKLDDKWAGKLDNDFAIDLSILKKYVNLDDVSDMIAVAKVDTVDGYGKRLRYANKLIIADNKLKLDSETIELLGDSIGPAGAGTYAVYYAAEQNGYIHGKVVDCDGGAIAGALAVINGGPFFTYSADDGSYALPTLDGYPGAVSLFGQDPNCTCVAAAPVTDTNTEEGQNPKSDDPNDTPASDQFADGTNAVDAGDCVCCPPEPAVDDDVTDDDTVDDDTVDDDTVDDDTVDDDTVDDDTVDDDTVDDDTVDDDSIDDDTTDDDVTDDDSSTGELLIDFENGSLDGWQITSDCTFYGISNQAYGELFPAGDQTHYLYVSTGGNQVPSCTLTLTVAVPDGATQAEISYNFVSQEYEEWVGSQYNDIFTVILQGGLDYLVNRTINNTATAEDWVDIAATDEAAVIADIASSLDASYNPLLVDPHSNGEYLFDGQLNWNNNASQAPRGEPENDNIGKTATVALPDGFSTITIIVTVSDTGDRIYDSVGLIDWIRLF